MTSTRSYRRGRPVPVAVEELERCAGSQFDPRMVRALARALDRHGWSAAANTVTSEEELTGLPHQKQAGERTGTAGRHGRPR